MLIRVLLHLALACLNVFSVYSGWHRGDMFLLGIATVVLAFNVSCALVFAWLSLPVAPVCSKCHEVIRFGWFTGFWTARHIVTLKRHHFHNNCVPSTFKEPQ